MLYLGSGTQGITFVRQRSGHYRAGDTALVLTGQRLGDRFEGVLRDGRGHERSVLAEAYYGPRAPLMASSPPDAPAFPPDFLTACGTEKWVRTFATDATGHRLTLAKLPGQRLRGSLYLADVGATLLASGELLEDGLDLQLTRLDGAAVGSLSAEGQASGRLSAKLQMGGQARELTLDLEEGLGVDCRQHEGRVDVLLPGIDGEPALERFADAQLRRLSAEGARGTVWFEPLRLDADVLSGYVHVQTDDGATVTEALTLDRRTHRLVTARRFATGSKRERRQAATERLRLAADTHPLSADEDFRTWLAAAGLSRVAVLTEGLAYATARHPVYGVVQWVTPWAELDTPLRNRTAALR